MKKNIETEERERPCLIEHDRLANLFRNNRFAFELERKRKIKELIASFPDKETREKFTLMQQQLDRVLRGAGSEHNRFVMMQVLFWEHIVNIWIPTLNSLKYEPNDSCSSNTKMTKSQLSLVHKSSSSDQGILLENLSNKKMSAPEKKIE